LLNEYLDFYKENFFTVIPIKSRTKAPEISAWQNRRPANFNPAEFDDETNVGVVLGDASGGLIDIDLDCEEALTLAPLFLPPTSLRFGRKSKPESHHFYRCQNHGRTVRLSSSDGRTLLECRGNGGQTVVPPSIHPTGEQIEFGERGSPAIADFEELLLRCKLMAIAIEIVPHWNSGSRHELSLAIAGALIRADVSLAGVFNVIKGICRLTGDEEEEDRLRSVESTAAKILRGEPTTGWPKLSKFLGSQLCDHLAKLFKSTVSVTEASAATIAAPFTRDSLNDAGNAERTKHLFGSDLIYVTQLRRFFCWNDVRWIEDVDNLKTGTLCLSSVDYYLSEVTGGQLATFDNEKVISFLRRSKDRAKLNAQFDLMKPMLVCDASELDASEHKIGCLNGIIDLSSGSHSAPDRAAKITKLLNVEHDPDADCPKFKKLVRDMLGDDQDKIDFVQRLAGYWLTGSTKFHIFPILVGDAATGKSTFVNAIKAVMGDYATDMMPNTLFETSANAVAQYDLATLRGRRFVVAQEAESEQRLRASLVKSLTGGDTLKVRLPYQDPWSMPPSAKFLMVANRRPNLDALDNGLKRRVVIIECGEAMPKQKRDVDLAEKLNSEKSGILNWLLAGWSEVRRSGLDIPAVVQEASSQFFNDRNELGAFWEECVAKAPGEKVPVGELYQAYCSYCAQEAVKARGQREFGQLLRTILKVEQCRTGSTRYWKGIRLDLGSAANDAGSTLHPRFDSADADRTDARLTISVVAISIYIPLRPTQRARRLWRRCCEPELETATKKRALRSAKNRGLYKYIEGGYVAEVKTKRQTGPAQSSRSGP
jgi:putative DNA primase/helicase